MDRDQRLREVITEYQKACAAGQRPDPAACLARYPDLANDLTRFFAWQQVFDGVAAIPAALVALFPPSADLLLDRARRQMDDTMLMQVARADYGEMADEMFAELRPIRDKGIIPAPMHGQLREVLALTRWCNPEMPESPPFEPGPTGRSGHQIRLFACAVLLRGAAEPPNEHIDGTEDSSLALSLTSAKVLGEEMSEAAARFLTWRIPRLRMESCGESDPLLFALGLLLLAIRLRAGRITELVLRSAAEWVLAVELLWRQASGPDDPSDPRPAAFSLQSGFWQPLAAELINEAAAIRAHDVRENVQLCALLLEPSSGC
jgi:hypothetical protein